jgi:23S rRNA (guanosine2251-2'-O)-methyltransferase
VPAVCPKCGSPLKVVDLPSPKRPENQVFPGGPKIEILLDNIRSTLNVGSILRSADGAGISHIYFCGITPTPDQEKVRKTSLGAELIIPWSQHWNAVDVIEEEKNKGKAIWSLEYSMDSSPIFEVLGEAASLNIILVVGNELTGVDPEILGQSDKVIHLPMVGEKKSFNVSVACGIAAYLLRFSDHL